MMKLSDREWKVFKIKEAFDIVNLKPEHKVNLKSSGTTPYVTRTEKNNGVEDFYKGLHIKKGNCITFGAETAKFYYQEHNFINGNKLYAIYNKSLNKYTALFLTTLFNNQFLDYGYGFGLTGARFSNKKIKLPTLNKHPDYNFMEDYIKEKYFNLKSQIKEKQKHEITDWRGLDEVEWMDFQINKLFYNKIGKNIDGNKIDKQNGKVPYVTRKESNNGLDGFIYNDKRIEEKLNISQNPVITIGNETAKPFVQNYDFFTGTKVNILQPIATNNIFSLRFISKMLEQQKKKYSYSFTINSRRLKKQTIKLPTKNNQPDYKFMEQYMKRKENEVLERI